MRSSSLLSVCILGSLLAAACGGDGDGGSASDPAGNKGGSSANKGGSSGASGAAGKAGSSATAGAAGSNAAAGQSGANGGGAAGMAGASAGGGSAGASASAGSAGAATAGASGGTSKGGGGGAAGNGTAGSGTAGTNGAGTGGTAGSNPGPCAVPTSLTLSPATITIVVDNNVSTPVPVTVTGQCPDGSTISPAATFGIDHFNVATVSTGGVVTGSTEQGGEATLTVTSGGVTTTAKVTVIVKKKLEEVTVTDPDKVKLETPAVDGSMKVVYPYDRTMFARGLFAPELMWNANDQGEVCAVTFKEDFFEATAYVSGAQPGRWLLNEKIWEGITASNHGEDVYVNIACLHGGVASAAPEGTWRVAQGSLRGSITYWAVNKGQIMKVSPNAPEAQPLFNPGSPNDVGTPTPVGYTGFTPPWNANDTGERCVACHTVSKNGARVAAVFSSNGGGNPWGTINQQGATPVVQAIGKYQQYARFQALSPDGKFDVVNTISTIGTGNTPLLLADADTGQAISSTLDTITDYTGAPAFANDGTKIAFPGHANGADSVEYGRSTLDVMTFDANNGAAGYFTDRKTIRPDDGGCYAFPSFSPASDFIVYQKGDYARANYGDPVRAANDALFVTDVNGVLGDIRLGLGSGDHLEPRQRNRSYQPTVNPIAVGGYMWVVFVSPRDYGNRRVTTDDPRISNKQLWVTAVDLNPKPGVDPSHPAFRLSGQNLDTINMSGYWSLDACHQNGDTCEAGYDCCGGYCRPDGTGKQVCADGAGTCAKVDEKCVTNADCCTGTGPALKCVGGFCAASSKD